MILMTDQTRHPVTTLLIELLLLELFLSPSEEIQNELLAANKKLLLSYGIDPDSLFVKVYDAFQLMGKDVRIGGFRIEVGGEGNPDPDFFLTEGAYRAILNDHGSVRIECIGEQGTMLSEISCRQVGNGKDTIRVIELKRTKSAKLLGPPL
jgi:hypothetical protein